MKFADLGFVVLPVEVSDLAQLEVEGSFRNTLVRQESPRILTLLIVLLLEYRRSQLRDWSRRLVLQIQHRQSEGLYCHVSDSSLEERPSRSRIQREDAV